MNKNLNTIPNKTKQETDIDKLKTTVSDNIDSILKNEEENEKEITDLINSK